MGLWNSFADYFFFEKQETSRGLFADLLKRYVLVVLLFGFGFYLLTVYTPEHGISNGTPGWMVIDSMYFSINTISTLGYGDIIPLGFSKILVSIEVTVGLLLFGIGIAKMISLKSETILKDIQKGLKKKG
jgi:hypothetical protein